MLETVFTFCGENLGWKFEKIGRNNAIFIAEIYDDLFSHPGPWANMKILHRVGYISYTLTVFLIDILIN